VPVESAFHKNEKGPRFKRARNLAAGLMGLSSITLSVFDPAQAFQRSPDISQRYGKTKFDTPLEVTIGTTKIFISQWARGSLKKYGTYIAANGGLYLPDGQAFDLKGYGGRTVSVKFFDIPDQPAIVMCLDTVAKDRQALEQTAYRIYFDFSRGKPKVFFTRFPAQNIADFCR